MALSDPFRLGAELMARWQADPVQMVAEEFHATPDIWQVRALRLYPRSLRLAMIASKGPGKSAVLAWIIWHFLLTRSQSQIAALAITGDNLRDNLWKELAYWRSKSKLASSQFEMTATKIFHREYKETWFCSARSYSQSADATQQANALSGLHAQRVMFVLDESGGMPDAVLAAVEGILANVGAASPSGIYGIDDAEAHVIQAGNPTHLSGPLYRAHRGSGARWQCIYITSDPDDPERTPRVSVEYARSQIEEFGRESPWVLVNIFGRFPPGSINALLTLDEVEAAEKRSYPEHAIAAASRRLGIDVARFGDDASVVFPRQGLQMFKPSLYRDLDSIAGARIAARHWEDFDADEVYIDGTAGFGSGWIDNLGLMRYAPISVHFGSRASTKGFANIRAEMAMNFARWIKKGGAIPAVPELRRALTETTYSFSKNGDYIIEPKESVKARLGFSPDHMDAGMLTFAAPESKRVARSLTDPVNRLTNRRSRAPAILPTWHPEDGHRINHAGSRDPMEMF